MKLATAFAASIFSLTLRLFQLVFAADELNEYTNGEHN